MPTYDQILEGSAGIPKQGDVTKVAFRQAREQVEAQKSKAKPPGRSITETLNQNLFIIISTMEKNTKGMYRTINAIPKKFIVEHPNKQDQANLDG